MKKILFITCAVLLASVLSVSAYTVIEGDTLSRIANSSNLTLAQVCELNPQITNPDVIEVGDQINTSKVNTTLPYFQKLAGTQEGLLGGNSINFVQVQNLYLSGSGISATLASIGLTSFKFPVNNIEVQMTDFGDIGYAVIEPDSPREENISFTDITQNANGSATLTGVSRGLGLSSPYTASTTLASAHAGGSLLRISNTAPFYNEFNIKGNDDTITGKWTFNVLPESALSATTTNQFTTKSYVDNSVNQGASTSTETTAGISELATQAELAAGTQWDANNPHVIQSEHATSTPDGTSYSASKVPVSEADGKLNQLWYDLSDSYTWTGEQNFTTATTTFTATTTATFLRGKVSFQMTALENITGGDAVVMGGAGVNRADASAASTSVDFIGFAKDTVTTGNPVDIFSFGALVDGFTGLTTVSTTRDYFLSDTTGAVSNATGTVEMYVGQAMSATELLVMRPNRPQYLSSAAGTTMNVPMQTEMANCRVRATDTNATAQQIIMYKHAGPYAWVVEDLTDAAAGISQTLTWDVSAGTIVLTSSGTENAETFCDFYH